LAQDKQFEATARRQQQAREKGQAPRSRDLVSAGLLLLAAMLAPVLFSAMGSNLRRATEAGLGHLHEFEFTREGLKHAFLTWALIYARVMAPLLIVIVAGSVLLTFLQGGLVLSLYPLTPRLDKLNPATAIKRIASAQGLVETLKSLLKLALVALVAWTVLHRHVPQLLLLGQMPPGGALGAIGRASWELCLKTALAMAVLGAADYLYQRFEYRKSLRMSREDMRQEARETEGDPQMRHRRRQVRQRIMRDGMSAGLRQATVVVTNPTHVAIALRYVSGQSAPEVVARGQGRLAERIKQLARRYAVPVRERPPLARALYEACPLGARIPPALYQAVAVILAELYREAAQRQQARRT
jgi:flagellar biosynthesis protein FlhB